MKGRKELLTIIVSTLLITFLFYKKSLGLNLFLFEMVFIGFLVIIKQLIIKSKNQKISFVGFLLTSLFTIITHSTFSYFIHFVALIIFIGVLNYPSVKSLVNALKISFVSFFVSQGKFLDIVFKSNFKGKNIGSILWKSRIFLIPIVIIALFIIIYAVSNPIFNNLISEVFDVVFNTFSFIFKDLEILMFTTILTGVIISNYLIIRTRNKALADKDLLSSDELVRQKIGYNNSGIMALKNEYKAAIFLFCTLNIILLILNCIDVYWVWFNFEWTGQFLKQFVHEGTFLLILSIIISIILVLYFFRNNLNFYKNNKWLKRLSYIWIAQNALLVISVGIRNFWYINYYSLAYKRIGVIIFLLLTLYGLYTVLVKVRNRKSSFYLLTTNSTAIFLVLIVCSLINWDTVIAKYNFNHSDKSYLHLEYLVKLSDKSLPYLDKSLSELSLIEENQKQLFPKSELRMTSSEYYRRINKRKEKFKANWENKNILEWNLADYIAYKKLFKD
ncbi:MAG: hypothetical protein COB12_03780 [Flavobacterium sp.]|nr:MAG: hypothetical protein COB12_03780 [Flavobacterium sp.]